MKIILEYSGKESYLYISGVIFLEGRKCNYTTSYEFLLKDIHGGISFSFPVSRSTLRFSKCILIWVTRWYDKLGSDAPREASTWEAVGLPKQYSP